MVDNEQLVRVTLTAHWKSGNATMDATVAFSAPSLDEALRSIRKVTPQAPLFRDPDSPEEE
jgi:hypothetical protein